MKTKKNKLIILGTCVAVVAICLLAINSSFFKLDLKNKLSNELSINDQNNEYVGDKEEYTLSTENSFDNSENLVSDNTKKIDFNKNNPVIEKNNETINLKEKNNDKLKDEEEKDNLKENKKEENKEEIKEVEKLPIIGIESYKNVILVDKSDPKAYCAQAIDYFWSDDNYRYYFTCIKSQYMYVVKNRVEMPLIKALETGFTTIKELEDNGYIFLKESRNLSVR